MSVSTFLGINQIVEIFCSRATCWTYRQLTLPPQKQTTYVTIVGCQTAKHNHFCLWHYKVLSHYLWSSFLHTFVVRSAGTATVWTLKLFFRWLEKRARINAWLTKMMWSAFEMIMSALGTQVCAVWPVAHTDMWRPISVCRGRKTTPSRIVPCWGVSWNGKIQRQWGTEHLTNPTKMNQRTS